ncbi:sugar phosphate isomerase/epimerase [Sandarakinorhabdus sp.]|uniref:sugar phosphate isomerase/epimerase family protein n=1 Tax=Sandarakinorhabdus sp. TaxID=1916663 RepID=UPI003341DAB5
MKPLLDRRTFISGAVAAAGLAGVAAIAKGLDPINPDISFGTTGSIFGTWAPAGPKNELTLQMSTDMPKMLAACRQYGLEGLEPYSGQVVQFLDNPMALKKLLDGSGVALASVGDLPLRPADRMQVPAGQYPWLGGEGRDLLIAQMERCARDFLQPLGVTHWKNNMGARPDGGPSDDQLKKLADTANEIGRRTLAHGVKLSLHPHIWGPMEREHEFRRIMELTDPRYVFLILDTGHNVLGGMDTPRIVKEFLPRITEVHLKDTFPKFKGNTSTPTREQHLQKGVYASVGQGGGVDFPSIFKVLREDKFKGWAVFDIDAPRTNDGTGSIDDNIAASVRYMRDALKVKLPPPGKPAF